MGQRLNIIVLAEGAIDTEGHPITCDEVKDVKTKQRRRKKKQQILFLIHLFL